jgi:hypothetical protein
VAPTHSRRALVSVNYHYYQQLLSGDHLHHGLLAHAPRQRFLSQ